MRLRLLIFVAALAWALFPAEVSAAVRARTTPSKTKASSRTKSASRASAKTSSSQKKPAAKKSAASKSARSRSTKKTAARKTASRKPSVASRRKAVATKRTRTSSRSRSAALRRRKSRRVVDPWKEPTYADSTRGDHIDGEDLDVRRAAVDALGPLNGSVVVVNAKTGRVLSIVNQKVAFENGYTPCSTVKIFVGAAGLNEGLIDRETPVQISSSLKRNLTEALARSDNPYFARLGEKLGFEKVVYYARMLGLGEAALLDDSAEKRGTLPKRPPSDGVGMMSSFGHGISLTPLQLAAALSALANGGTLYHLQYPRSRDQLEQFVPRAKRHLDIGSWLEDLKPGMMAAVEEGTARRAGYNQEATIYGKTGTCTDTSSPTHLGWFGSFNEAEHNPLAVVVLLTGGRPINGPVASGVAGHIYRTLYDKGYFAAPKQYAPPVLPPVSLVVPRLIP